MKKKDQSLSHNNLPAGQQQQQGPRGVRQSGTVHTTTSLSATADDEKEATASTAARDGGQVLKSAAGHTYDKGYKKWEKFDVDKALDEIVDTAADSGEEGEEEAAVAKLTPAMIARVAPTPAALRVPKARCARTRNNPHIPVSHITSKPTLIAHAQGRGRHDRRGAGGEGKRQRGFQQRQLRQQHKELHEVPWHEGEELHCLFKQGHGLYKAERLREG